MISPRILLWLGLAALPLGAAAQESKAPAKNGDARMAEHRQAIMNDRRRIRENWEAHRKEGAELREKMKAEIDAVKTSSLPEEQKQAQIMEIRKKYHGEFEAKQKKAREERGEMRQDINKERAEIREERRENRERRMEMRNERREHLREAGKK